MTMQIDNAMRDVLVGEVTQVPAGEGRVFAVAGRRIALFHTRSGEFYATQPSCPHKGGPLADGLVGAATVICPLHDRTYDLRSGLGPEGECGRSGWGIDTWGTTSFF